MGEMDGMGNQDLKDLWVNEAHLLPAVNVLNKAKRLWSFTSLADSKSLLKNLTSQRISGQISERPKSLYNWEKNVFPLEMKNDSRSYNLLPRDYVLLPSTDYERAKKIHVGITLNNYHWHSRKVPSIQSFLTFTHSLLFPWYFHKPGPIGKPGLNGALWPHVVTSICRNIHLMSTLGLNWRHTRLK